MGARIGGGEIRESLMGMGWPKETGLGEEEEGGKRLKGE